jgi:hypothetical protein
MQALSQLSYTPEQSITASAVSGKSEIIASESDPLQTGQDQVSIEQFEHGVQ